ncbi:MAG: pilus assembly protein, partial [Parazoarcus communis]
MTPRRLSLHLFPAVLTLLASAGQASTDISNTPLITNQVSVKPNLMFVLDNSGSMNFGYMPEEMGSSSQYGYRSAQCNGAAYNPANDYPLPVTPDGRSYPAMSATAAWSDGFIPSFDTTYSVSSTLNTVVPEAGLTQTVIATGVSSSATPFAVGDTVVVRKSADKTHWMVGRVMSITGAGTNTRTLSVAFSFSSAYTGSVSGWIIGKPLTEDLTSSSGGSAPDASYYYRYTGSQPAMSWAYNADGTLTSGNTFNSECRSSVNSAPGSGVFARVNVSSLASSSRGHYANWYSYYRRRILMMRSAAGRAMASLDSSYRVGFSSLNNGTDFNSTVTPTLGLFANIAEYNDAQRLVFFSNLYGAHIQGGTPLRRALAKAGQYYGGVIPGQTDPVQHACQRNYTLLTTDGYWNDNTLPTQLDRTSTIGNQDGNPTRTPLPQYDSTADYRRVEQRTRYETLGRCGFLNFSYSYRAVVERRTVSSTFASGETTSAWTVFSVGSNQCEGSVPATSSITVVSSDGGGGQRNTLADVASYYYQTDLRPNMPNSVPSSASDPARHQHMTTYTLGLGLSGLLRYDRNYLTQTTGDFAAIKAGTRPWPAPPLDATDHPAKIDDLWHAAVNGHGRYFSANNANDLTSSLVDALSDINARNGAGAAAASSSFRPIEGTDRIFKTSYRTRNWDGELEAFTVTRGTNNTLTFTNVAWSAAGQLDARPYGNRTIYYQRRVGTVSGGSTASLGLFTYENISSDADAGTLRGHFDNFCTRTPQPTQCSALTSQQRTAASGANLVNFLRGDRTSEGSLYRQRASVLGSLVDASPTYVGKPPFVYQDPGYSAFAQALASRCPMVYVAGNDGMLHAFSDKTNLPQYSSCPEAGSEVWAYVPRAVMSNLYLLADSDYANRHRFFVNGTPEAADISIPGTDGSSPIWRTILVGGFGAGGRGYYALDVTSPTEPRTLWEFSDADMGLSFGNPVVTKIPGQDGVSTWVVAFTSGLNNSGNGYLYVVNAYTGALMYKVPTLVNGAAVGTSSAPSGLNKLNAWVDRPTDNTAVRFYAGDMRGNVWRFNVSDLASVGTPDNRALRLAQLSANNVPQPITTRPELAEILYSGSRHAVVMIGTGRFIGVSDVSDTTSRQSVYGIRDPLGSSGWGNPRAQMIEQTFQTEASGQTRQVSNNTVNWSSSTVAGWYIDLPDAG